VPDRPRARPRHPADDQPWHIRALRGATPKIVRSATPPSAERIARFEDRYEIWLPAAYRALVEAFGDLTAVEMPYRLLGLSDDRTRRPTTASALAELRSTLIDFPSDLLPVEVLPDSQVACLQLTGSNDPPVVVIDAERLSVGPVPAAARFSEFCGDWLSDVRGMGAILRHARRLDRLVEQRRRPPDKQDRPDDWRAYRFCSQDVIVGATLVRHNRDDHVTEVAALPCTTLTSHADDAPLSGLLALVLSDAYRSGGNLSLQFVNQATENPRPVPIPHRVRRFAAAHGVPLARAGSGHIDADAGRRLFVEAIECPEGLRDLLRDDVLAMSAPAACFAVTNGIWDASAVEYVARTADDAGRVLAGLSRPLDGVAWESDLDTASRALLVSGLVTRRATSGGLAQARDAEDVVRHVETISTASRTVVLRTEGEEAIEVLPVFGDEDLLIARIVELAEWLGAGARTASPCMLVPRDVERVDPRRVEQAESAGVRILVSPLFSTTIAAEAARSLERARTSRR
jgi:hypothetical protein